MFKSKKKIDQNKINKITKKNNVKQETVVCDTEHDGKIFITKNQASWIRIVRLSDQQGLNSDEFVQLWKAKPEEKCKIKIWGKMMDCPRYTKSYLKSYKFTGLTHEADTILPMQVERILHEHAHTLNCDLNQSLVNWYEADGSIGKHSDDTRQLKPDSEIFSYSFGNAKRDFILEPMEKGDGPKYKIPLNNNILIIMGGKCQETHRHSVPANKNQNTERRINITFRCFK